MYGLYALFTIVQRRAGELPHGGFGVHSVNQARRARGAGRVWVHLVVVVKDVGILHYFLWK
jgi:hypothetical protein